MSQPHPQEVSFSDDFGSVLRALMRRPTHVVTPGWLSKTSGIPKATIVNWLEGRVARPRTEESLRVLCEALRLSSDEMPRLFAAAGIVPPPPSDAQAVFDHVPFGLYTTTPDGCVLHANLALVKMLGYASRREYCNLDVARDLYVSADQRRVWLAKIARFETLLRQPAWAKRADGSRVLVLDSATAIRNAQGHVVRFEGVWELIGEQ